jgi:hypothetical protein
MPWSPIVSWDIEVPTFLDNRLTTDGECQLYAPAGHSLLLRRFLVFISDRGWVDPQCHCAVFTQVSCLVYSSTPKMETCSSETSADLQRTTRPSQKTELLNYSIRLSVFIFWMHYVRSRPGYRIKHKWNKHFVKLTILIENIIRKLSHINVELFGIRNRCNSVCIDNIMVPICATKKN